MNTVNSLPSTKKETWTPSQLTAINSKNKTLLLSAAAGSGKTSTLTERIIRSIIDKDTKADISKMLIVTFTRASANDLRAKIFKELSKALAKDPSNKHLTEQLVKLGGANISTIDAFYLSAVRQNFSLLGISSSFRIADNSETDVLARSIMSDVVNNFYDTDDNFPALCECFEKIKDEEDAMENVLLKLYGKCLYTPEGVEYLRDCAESTLADKDKDIFDTEYGKLLKDLCIMMFEDYLEYYDKVLGYISEDEYMSPAYYEQFNNDRIMMIKVLDMLKGQELSYSSLRDLLISHEFIDLGTVYAKNSTEKTYFCKDIRESFKASFRDLVATYFCYATDDFPKYFEATSKNLDILYRVLYEFENRYNEEKKSRNILELKDVKRYALKLFADEDQQPTETAKKYSEQFSHIYIDEYQDVDPVQDLIFRCIAKPTNRFMVGDIKQSIYSFRGAEPQLFSHYRAQFPNHNSNEAQYSDCETIFMSENFRCARPIINFTNLVCSGIFTACKDSIGYSREDDLVFKKIVPENAAPSPKVTVAYVGQMSTKERKALGIDKDKWISAGEAEAKYIASCIRELLEHGTKENGERYVPGDIAVLFRQKTSAKHIATALSELNIKCNITESTSYFENPDVLMTLCILNAVDNPQRDIHLAGALYSPIYNFTLDDILMINRYGESSDSLYDKLCLAANDDTAVGKKCKKFNDTLCSLRNMSVSLPVDKFLRKLFETDEFVASGLVCEKGPTGEGGNLQRLYEYARTFEMGSFKGLYNFIEFINTLIENGSSLESTGQDISADCVTLTTIHKSKGLEFPVCFICSAATRFKKTDSGAIAFEYGIGVAMDLADQTGFAHYASPLKKMLEIKTSIKYTEEEMRILYVGMTRAKEKLYITGNYPKTLMKNVLPAAEFNAKFDCVYNIFSASSYMDWVLSACCAANDDTDFEIFCFTPDQFIGLDTVEAVQEQEATEINTELYEQLSSKFTYEYPYKALKNVPSKLSVSRLSPSVLDDDDSSLELFENRKTTKIPDFFLPAPSKSSATERGTATHLFLQFCNFKNVKENGAKAELDALLEKGYITDELSKLLYMSDLEKIVDSELITKILNAKKVIREQRFNILLPTDSFTQSEELRAMVEHMKTAVQGVIDLIIVDESGDVSLYDYKTDRLTQEELADDTLAASKLTQAHGPQLSYYAKAVEYLFGKKPSRIAIYSTCSAKLYDIPPSELSLPHDIL